MRFLLAILAFIASAALFVVAGVQIAQAQGTNSVSFAGSGAGDAPLIVVPTEVLTSNAGAQTIHIQGDGPIQVAVGRQHDVAGWVGLTSHETAHVGEENTLTFTAAGEEPTSPSILGNDMWLDEYEGEGSLEIELELPPGYAVLISSDGTAPAAANLTVTWPLDGRAPWAGPLLIGGAVLLLIALGLLLWALVRMRKERLPRRQSVAVETGTTPTSPVTPDPGGEADLDSADLPAVSAAVEETAGMSEESDSGAPWSAVPWAKPAADEDTAVEETARPVTPPTDAADASPESVVDAPVASPENSGFQWGGLSEPVANADTTLAAEEDSATETAQVPPALPAETAAPTESPAEIADAPSDSTESKPDDNDDATPPTPPSPPAQATPDTSEDAKWKRPRGRDRTSAPKRLFSFAPILVASALVLTGCSPALWPSEWGGLSPDPLPTPTSTIDEALAAEGAPLPSLTEAQLTNILDDVAAKTAEADAANDASLLGGRLAGAALVEREALYNARVANGELAGPRPFTNGGAVYIAPVATNEWPRVVFAVVQPDASDADATPFGVTLEQVSARDNYVVTSLQSLSPNVQMPAIAPAEIGTGDLASVADSLLIHPNDLAAAYGDMIMNGDGSAFAALFDPATDTLRDHIGQEYRDNKLASIDTSASSLTFTNGPGEEAPAGIATLDGGAIVAVTMREVERLQATTQLATITVTGSIAALAGATESRFGFESVYTDQLLFYVPPADSGELVQFLGFSQAMTSARELDQSEVSFG